MNHSKAIQLLSELTELSINAPTHKVDIFIDTQGHVKSTHIRIVTGCMYEVGEKQTTAFECEFYWDEGKAEQLIGEAIDKANDLIALNTQGAA